MKYLCKLIILFGICLPLISTRRVEFYRRDYIYVPEFDAFYKMHWSNEGYSWNSAFLACDDEEAKLFYPKLKRELALVNNLTLALKDTPNVTDIFVGVHDRFGVGEFITTDGYAFEYPVEDKDGSSDEQCVIMNIKSGIYKIAPCVRFPYTPLPFICKRNEYEYCPTIDPGYKYIKSSKKCYKVHKRGKTWDEAARSCYMEGGILIVLQNKAEANSIKDSLITFESDKKYYTGVKKIYNGGDFYTITGQNIGDVYNQFSSDSEKNDCGVLHGNNRIYITSEKCDIKLPFICEMNTK